MYNDQNSSYMDSNEKAELTELLNKVKDIFVVKDGYQVLRVMKKTELPKKTVTYTEEIQEMSSARELQSVVSSWYITLRNIALVALLSVLVYIGIRITLSSVASDKAKYKQMLGDWVIALCLVFLMHYIMSFAVTINSKIIDAISSITISSIGSDDDILGSGEREYDEKTKSVEGGENIQDVNGKTKGVGVQLFVIEEKTAVDRAYKTLVGDKDDPDKKSGKYSSYNKNFSEDKSKLFWVTTDFMAQARMLGQDEGEDGTSESQASVTRAGYNIIYVVLVIYTVIFCFTYLKRVIYMAFLTIIAPLVAITYPIDKINDGKAQAFDMWLKEYIFNLLIQPMHLILYTILVGSAMKFAAQNIFYVVVALGFLIPAEKLLRRFFGFEKAQTPGLFAGAAGSALMMSGLNKLMHPKPPKGGLGSGGNSSKGEEEETTKAITRKDKGFDSTDNLLGIGDGDNADDNVDRNVPNGGRDENTNPLLDAYDENYGTDEWDAQERDRLARETNDNSGMQYSDDEYRQILRDSGYSDQEIAELMRKNNSNTNSLNNPIKNNRTPTNTSQPNRKRSIRRAIGRGARHYFKGPNGLGQKMINKHKANGGFVRRGARMAAGVAAAGTLAAAGGIIGITSGDPSKAAQYMAAGAAGGYTLGKGAVNSVSDSLKVDGTLSEAKKAYYGDDYKEVQRKKDIKKFMKNEENLRKIEDKLKVERKDAKKIMEEDMKYYLDQGGYGIDDLIALYGLEKDTGLNKQQVDSIGQYAMKGMNGEDTRYMTEKKKKEYRDTFIPKFTQKGSKNPDADVNKLFSYLDKYHELKN